MKHKILEFAVLIKYIILQCLSRRTIQGAYDS